jgi:hypothetical protein
MSKLAKCGATISGLLLVGLLAIAAPNRAHAGITGTLVVRNETDHDINITMNENGKDGDSDPTLARTVSAGGGEVRIEVHHASTSKTNFRGEDDQGPRMWTNSVLRNVNDIKFILNANHTVTETKP